MAERQAPAMCGDADLGSPKELRSDGTALENPYAYDAAAKESKWMASKGLLKIFEERRVASDPDSLIQPPDFRKFALVGGGPCNSAPLQRRVDCVHRGPPEPTDGACGLALEGAVAVGIVHRGTQKCRIHQAAYRRRRVSGPCFWCMHFSSPAVNHRSACCKAAWAFGCGWAKSI